MQNREENIRAVENVLVGMQEGDVKRILTVLDDEARWVGGDSVETLAQGKDAISKVLESKSAASGLHLLDTTIHADGDHVFAEYTRSPSHDAAADGSEHVLTVFEMAFGKIREVREFTRR